MPYKDKLKEAEFQKDYYLQNKDKLKAAMRKYREDNKEKIRAANRAWHHAHKVEVNERRKKNMYNHPCVIAMLEVKSHGCAHCGIKDTNLSIFDLHHVDPKSKLFSISIFVAPTRTLEEVTKELTKCIVLCANCHRKLHHKE